MEVKTYPTVMYGKPPQFQAALHDGLEDSGLFVPHAENAHTAEVIIQHIQDYFNLTDTNPGDQVQQTGDQKSGDLPATQMQQEQLQAEQSPPQPKPIQTVPPVAIANGGMANGNQDADAIDEEDRIIEEEDDGSARADLRDIIAATVQVLQPRLMPHNANSTKIHRKTARHPLLHNLQPPLLIRTAVTLAIAAATCSLHHTNTLDQCHTLLPCCQMPGTSAVVLMSKHQLPNTHFLGHATRCHVATTA